MPADYQIDRAQSLVLSRAWGEVTPEDFLNHGRRLQVDPEFRPGFRQLWDMTEISRTTASFAELSELAKVNVFTPTTRRAIIAPADLMFGMGRMFQSLRETKGETGIRVFRQRAEALRWLENGEDPAAAPRGSTPS